MGEWVSYPKFVSPATKTLHPNAAGTDLTLHGGLAVGNNENPLDGQIKLGSAAGSGYLTFYDGSYRDGYIDAANLYLQINGVTKTTIGANGITAGSFAPGAIVNADVSTSAAITPDKLSGPLFSYYRNSSSNNVTGNGTVYTCLFDTAVISNANYNTSTGIFTAPAAGKYLFVGKVGVASGSSGGTQGEVNVVTTGRSYRYDGNPYGNRHIASGVTSIPFAVIASMAQNDTAKVTLTVTGDGSDIADFIGGAFSDFAGWRVG